MSIFEQASRLKLRFDSLSGKLNVEDLWDLPLTDKPGKINGVNLDNLAKAVNRQLRNSDTEESFVLKSTPSNVVEKLKLEVLKHIIGIRLAEAEAAEKAAINKAKKQQILSLIAQKQDAALSDKSIEELSAMVEGLN